MSRELMVFSICVLSLLWSACRAQNQTEPPLAGSLPEASLNNILHQESALRNQLLQELIKDMETLRKRVDSKDQQISSLQQELASVNAKLLNMNLAFDFFNHTIHDVLLSLLRTQHKQVEIEDKLRLSKGSHLREVVFTAGITSTTAIGSSQTVVFPHVITNKGNAYNPSNGVFIAPVNGTYLFFCSIMSMTTDNSWVIINKNGVSQVVIGAYGSANDNHSSASNIVNLELIKGDRVWVAGYALLASFHLYAEQNNPIATFSGILL